MTGYKEKISDKGAKEPIPIIGKRFELINSNGSKIGQGHTIRIGSGHEFISINFVYRLSNNQEGEEIKTHKVENIGEKKTRPHILISFNKNPIKEQRNQIATTKKIPAITEYPSLTEVIPALSPEYLTQRPESVAVQPWFSPENDSDLDALFSPYIDNNQSLIQQPREIQLSTSDAASNNQIEPEIYKPIPEQIKKPLFTADNSRNNVVEFRFGMYPVLYQFDEFTRAYISSKYNLDKDYSTNLDPELITIKIVHSLQWNNGIPVRNTQGTEDMGYYEDEFSFYASKTE